MVTGVLTWHNQNGRTAYPLADNNAVMNDFIVDANFVQFDNFVPVLETVLVSAIDLSITITFDLLQVTLSYLKSTYTGGTHHVSFYDGPSYNKRFLGRLVFGYGVNNLWNNYSNQLLTFGVPFLASTVRSIPSTDAIYTIDQRFGNVVLSHASADRAIFYNTDPTNNWITLNAVQNSRMPTSTPVPALKLLNLVAPVNNNVFIGYNDVIQINKTTAGGLNIAVVTSNFAPSTVVPTLAN